MSDLQSLREALSLVQHGVDAYEKTQSIADYKDLQAQIRRLQVAAATPEDTLFTFRLQVTGNIAISILNELNVLETLVVRFGGKASAADLASATNSDELFIARLMRVASALCFCEEVDEQLYESNQVTVLLAQPGWVGALRWMDLMFPVAANIRKFISSPDFDRNNSKWIRSPFEYVHGKSMWKMLEEDPDQRRNFDVWMRERKKHQETSWHKIYPPFQLLKASDMKTGPDAVMMVDVGGANGSQLINFKSQVPDMPGRFVLQDLPESVASVIPPDGVEVMAYDFFTPQPIKGARFYYLRNVIHNWPTDKCSEILANIAAAMDPGYSSLLIDDYVLPRKGAELRSAIADVHMMNLFNSSERTEAQYEQMVSDAGLEIIAIYPAGMNEESIIEARLVKRA